MATITNTTAEMVPFTNIKYAGIVHSWANMAQDDDGNSITLLDYSDRTVQVFGTFGGATVTLEGSLDGTNWSPLTDALGNELAYSVANLAVVLEAVPYVRPNVTGGDGTTDITVLLLTRREILK